MTSPALLPPVGISADSIRYVRNTVARDIAASRRRIGELSAQLRAERGTLASLEGMAELVNVTDVSTERTADVVDAGVTKPPESESPTG